MSTTRWIIETPCEHGKVRSHFVGNFEDCLGGNRIVVDPDNLPPEAIERAVRAFLLIDEGPFPFLTDDELWQEWWEEAGHEHYADPMEAAVRALLSDPEPGDQT